MSGAAAIAFAEALLPAAHGVPGADDRVLSTAPDLMRALGLGAFVGPLTAIQQALDYAAVLYTGRKFSRSSNQDQEELLQRWSSHPVFGRALFWLSLFYKWAHFDDEAVAARLGAPRQRERKTPAVPDWMQSQVIRGVDLVGDTLTCDVVVVGTGAGGAVVGAELAERGHAVVFLEQGDYLGRDSFAQSSVQAFTQMYAKQVVTLGNAPIGVFAGRLVGGSTAVNTATCWRPPDQVLKRWCEKCDTDVFSSDALRPHFERVESILSITEASEKSIGPFADIVARGCDHHNWSHRRVARNATDCDGKSFCQFGCPSDSRRSTNLTYIPRALQRGALLLTGVKAERVITHDGRAEGMIATDRAGRVIRVRSQAVVLAAGALASPVFLLEQGIGNTSGMVGRNLSLHPCTGLVGMMDEKVDHQNHVPQGYACDEFLSEGTLIIGAGTANSFMPMQLNMYGRDLMRTVSRIDRVAALGAMVEDGTAPGRVWGQVRGRIVATYWVTDDDVRRLHQASVRMAKILWAAGARSLHPAVFGWGSIATKDQLADYCRARPRAADFQLVSYHPLGTCAIGRNARKAVVGLDHETHDIRGLFVVDGSTVPTPPGVNPQVTIMALATRAAQCVELKLN